MTADGKSTLVSTDWLARHLDAPDIRILDASWHLPDENRDAAADYTAAHIPGAVFFDIDRIADPDRALPHMLPSTNSFADHMKRLGIGDDTKLVVYDTGGVHGAARAWWMFRVFGLTDVAVLDGGLDKWRSEGRPLDTAQPDVRTRTLCARRNDKMIADLAMVAHASETGQIQILDARSTARFNGQEQEARPGLRSGHIPGSLNLPYKKLYNDDGTMKDENSLKALFTAAGLDMNKPVITTCGSGITACSLALALSVTGHDNWSVYDGSWAEWGASPSLPVATSA